MRALHAGLHVLGSAVLLSFAALSCAAPPSSTHDPVVATVDEKPVLASELLEASQGQVMALRKQEYDIRRRALDSVIEQRILDAEASRRGITVRELTKDIEKVVEPSESEVEAFYLARSDLLQRRFDEVRDQMRSALKLAKRNAARDALLSELRQRHVVEVLLEPPRVDVAFDPARLQGSPEASVRIVEFSDFECPYCRSVEKTLQAILAKYRGRVSLAYRDFPLSGIHPGAQRAAEASQCAAAQGKYWPYHDRLLASASLDDGKLKEHAKDLALDQKKFDACLDTGSMRAAVERDTRQGRLAGVVATPSFFINGIPLNGAQPAAAFEKIIDEELARIGPAVRTTASR